jgi:hypothetical protein
VRIRENSKTLTKVGERLERKALSRKDAKLANQIAASDHRLDIGLGLQ